MPVSPFKRVLKRARGAGFETSFVRQALPVWWDDEAADHPSGLEEGIGYLASRLGLAPSSLRDGPEATFETTVQPKFKTRSDVSRDALVPTEHVAVRALQLALRAAPQPGPLRHLDARSLRRELLADRHPWVTFDLLLDWCWRNGIAVLHLSTKVGKKKMDGLAARFAGLAFADGDRYGIALCCNHKAPSWLLFHLAHEVAHVMLGHLPENGVIVDESVDSRMEDEQEVEADAYAWTLLSGTPSFEPFSNPGWNGPQLARAAAAQSQQLRIAPGTLALSHGYRHGMWGAAQSALKLLEGDRDAPQAARNALLRQLDWPALSADDVDYLRTLSGLDETRG